MSIGFSNRERAFGGLKMAQIGGGATRGRTDGRVGESTDASTSIHSDVVSPSTTRRQGC